MSSAALELDVEFCGTDDQRAMMAAMYLGVTVSIVHVTPELAKHMLTFNKKNRNLDKRNVAHICDAIVQGDWYLNGETIIFAEDGSLLNGQHRLVAIIASGVGVDVMVVRGINPAAFRTMDGGRVRRAGEVLTMDGEKNGNKVAAAVQALLAFVDAGGRFYGGSCAHGRKATPSACHRILTRHPGLRESVREVNRNSLYHSQHAAVLHYLFSKVSEAVAAAFADVLSAGDADLGRPFVIFRESLVKVPVCSENRLSIAAKAIKAFNAELLGDRPKMFKFLASEDFPTISGLDYERLADSVG